MQIREQTKKLWAFAFHFFAQIVNVRHVVLFSFNFGAAGQKNIQGLSVHIMMGGVGVGVGWGWGVTSREEKWAGGGGFGGGVENWEAAELCCLRLYCFCVCVFYMLLQP